MIHQAIQRKAFVLALLGAAVPVLAETHNVSIVGLEFVPANLKITTGDTVTWSWTSAMAHNVESGVSAVHDGNFKSGLPSTTGNYSVVFDETYLAANAMTDNLYPYYCIVHVGVGMVGSITVSPPIPAVSQWGLVVMGLLVLVAGTVAITRRRRGSVAT